MLQELTLIHAPVERVFDLARSVEVHLLGNVHSREQALALGGKTTGLLTRGDSVLWQARHFGVRQQLQSVITRFDPPHAFQDTMVRGAFRWMQHDHFFRPREDGMTEMRDVLRFVAPLGLFGRIAELLVLQEYMRGLLYERNAVLKQVAESDEWRHYLPAGGA